MFQGHCDHALLPDGWHANVRLTAGDDGRWLDVQSNVPRGDLAHCGEFVIPGMPNLHSHAFQRAMAGSAERFGRPDDSFWSWREAMYRHAGLVDPEALHAIARWLYCEMLEQGYTRVAEFHYVHHRPDGRRYLPTQAMSQALIAAAEEAGIGLTLLPTLYQRGGFRDEALASRQQRFRCGSDEFLALCEALATPLSARGMRLGAAVHSLRAVSGDSLREVFGASLWRDRPLHIHIAEQRKEVADCLAVHARRPIEHLFDQIAIDRRHCLVHATHANSAEMQLMARSGAVVGICTTTEANLGDGLFALADLRELGGRWGIGSDSQVGLDPREELRWLEYQSRLASGRRTVLGDATHADIAANLWLAASAGGAQACGSAAAGLQAGADADWLVLDTSDPALAGCSTDTVMGAWLFAPARHPPLSVGVGGRVLATQGRHARRSEYASAYRRAVIGLGRKLQDGAA
ncbi:MAG: formimidoylglutamate deiminase [Rhodanobacteraceae bacterium]|nr:formimidoylglutamate deiminase [Rhodanobacteraceae bacterium]